MSDVKFDQKPQPTRGAPLLDCYDDLAGSQAHAWDMLVRGAKQAKAAFHTPSVATINLEDGVSQPDIRTVVLRDCDRDAKTLRFNTDTRSNKIRQIAENPQAAMHFYDAQAKIQLRVKVTLVALQGPAYDTAWQNTRPMSRECYQVLQSPGAPVDAPSDVSFDAAATDDGADHFASIEARVHTIEWLYLAPKGHRRALFDIDADRQQWLVP